MENAWVLKLGPWEYLSVYMFMPFVMRKLLAEIVIQLVCLKVRVCMTVLFFPTANKNEREPKSLHKTGTCVLGCLSHVRLFATLWTVARQTPLSMWFSRQEYWSGLPCPPPGDPPNSGIEPASLVPPALASRFFTTSTTWEAQENR